MRYIFDILSYLTVAAALAAIILGGPTLEKHHVQAGEPAKQEAVKDAKPKPVSEVQMLKIENVLLKITMQQRILQDLVAERDRIAVDAAKADGVDPAAYTLDLQSRAWVPKAKPDKK